MRPDGYHATHHYAKTIPMDLIATQMFCIREWRLRLHGGLLTEACTATNPLPFLVLAEPFTKSAGEPIQAPAYNVGASLSLIGARLAERLNHVAHRIDLRYEIDRRAKCRGWPFDRPQDSDPCELLRMFGLVTRRYALRARNTSCRRRTCRTRRPSPRWPTESRAATGRHDVAAARDRRFGSCPE